MYLTIIIIIIIIIQLYPIQIKFHYEIMINDCVNSWISPGSWIVGQRGHVSSRRSQVGGGVSGLVQTVQRGRGRGPLAAHVTDCFPPSNQRSLPQSPAVINHPTLTNELEQSASHLTYHGHSGRDGGEQAAYSMASIYDMQREGFKFDFVISTQYASADLFTL